MRTHTHPAAKVYFETHTLTRFNMPFGSVSPARTVRRRRRRRSKRSPDLE